MPTATYSFADIKVSIESIYPDVHDMCAQYLAPDAVDIGIHIHTTPEEIEREATWSDEQRLQEGLPPYRFSDTYLETLAVYRQMAEQLPLHGVMLMHGSVVAVDGVGYMFTADSGTGKSTHVSLWRQMFGPRAVMINDDKPLVRLTDRGAVVYGTPWDGKHHLSTNTSVPLRHICVLKRGNDNHIEPMRIEDAFPHLLRQSFRPTSRESMVQHLRLLCQLASHVGLHELHCNMHPDAARVAYDGMTK